MRLPSLAQMATSSSHDEALLAKLEDRAAEAERRLDVLETGQRLFGLKLVLLGNDLAKPAGHRSSQCWCLT